MIALGKYNTLTILEKTDKGLTLGDESNEKLLLPEQYAPEKSELGQSIEVFVYHDNEGKKTATLQKPKIKLYQFTLLQVVALTKVGAFLNWGLDKDLLVPFSEQKQEMKEGRWYVVYLDIDETTNRLFASSNIEKQLQNINITVETGQEVDLLVYKQTDLGYAVIINNEHEGLVYENEVFAPINIGNKIKGYVKKVREDNHIDISLQPIGYRKFNDVNSNLILTELKKNNGFLSLTDKSSPEDIYSTLGISKKAFKKAIGFLYKNKIISLEETGIKALKKHLNN
ncbi:S1-like domain-containing RNA-binding protein [Aureibaculum sp. 2210JD6-5]|uniref:CvfB family protein n=1 Tax=Aureibaculum sp. 2210JD6-5 TaxID=3103957 RepID=UPI002AAF09AF|nr:S1-like domain-containing RNA-binding protein [Aureibaculum sp. 2210JD6-5]MDY7395380.1 S1-like domain-containing RNA-binding protein [Aureibaculum sp. 2210JD6-5]